MRRLALQHLETHIKAARILGTYVFPNRSSFPSYLLVLEGGLGVLAKPEDEHQDGPLIARREAAAWVIAREMGWPDLVSVTVLRELLSQQTASRVQASLQVLWPAAGTQPLSAFDDADVWRAAVFDAVIRNADRGGPANWLAIPSHEPRPMLKLLDHGYSLEPGLGAPSSVFFDQKQGQPLPQECMEALRRLAVRLPASEISDVVPMDTVDGVLERMERLRVGGLQF